MFWLFDVKSLIIRNCSNLVSIQGEGGQPLGLVRGKVYVKDPRSDTNLEICVVMWIIRAVSFWLYFKTLMLMECMFVTWEILLSRHSTRLWKQTCDVLALVHSQILRCVFEFREYAQKTSTSAHVPACFQFQYLLVAHCHCVDLAREATKEISYTAGCSMTRMHPLRKFFRYERRCIGFVQVQHVWIVIA